MEMFKREMETIEMPKALVAQMFMDVHALAQMHENLIEMYEIESQLKKQHKAYLHVRDKAEKMCKNDKADVNEILDHYENPGKYIDQALEIYADMLGEEMEEEAKAELFPPEDFMKMMFDMQRLLSMLEILNEVLYRIQEGRADEVDMDIVTSGTQQLVESVGNRWGRIMILDGIK